LALAVGRALAALHAQGLVHGAVSEKAVLLGSQARPLLDASPMVRGAGPPAGAPADPTDQADDVAALGTLLSSVVADPVPLAMRAALSAARDPDPDLRPSAADLV